MRFGDQAGDRGTVLWSAGFLTIISLHFLWGWLNDTPPVWDMASHQLMGWAYLDAWREGELWSRFAELSTYYPPLYYLQEAFILGIIGKTKYLPLLANLPGLFLLSWCSFRIGARFLDSVTAACAGLLPLLFPLVAWISRESLLDVPLSGWVALGVYLLIRSEDLQKRTIVLLFGATAAAGLLTKWTFGVFLIVPVLIALYRSNNRKASLVNLLYAALLSIPVVSIWYYPNLGNLYQRFQSTATTGVAYEQDPGLSSWRGWIYYPRSLSSYYLFLPLALAAASSLAVTLYRKTRDRAATLGWLSLGGGLLLMTLLQAKDPRYVMPVVSVLGVAMLAPWKSRSWVSLLLLAIAFGQFLLISFPFPFTPPKIAFQVPEDDLSYVGMGREWVLFEPDYFGVSRPARKENWRYEEILERLDFGSQVAFLPEMPFFHVPALQLAARKAGKDLSVIRLGQDQLSIRRLDSVGWVLGKTGSQGLAHLTGGNQEIYGELEREAWPVVGSWDLPDRSRALLWQRP